MFGDGSVPSPLVTPDGCNLLEASQGHQWFSLHSAGSPDTPLLPRTASVVCPNSGAALALISQPECRSSAQRTSP